MWIGSTCCRDARPSACFPLFCRLYFAACPGASVLFEIRMHNFLWITHFSLRSLETVVNRVWSCAAWAPDKTRCVRLWTNMQSPHSTCPITRPASQNTRTPGCKEYKCITEVACDVIFDLHNMWTQIFNLSVALPPQPWAGTKALTNQAVPQRFIIRWAKL